MASALMPSRIRINATRFAYPNLPGNPDSTQPKSALASLVIKLTGSRSKIVHRPRPQDDPRQRRPDISKASDILKWAPKTTLADGLRKTIDYFEELLSDDGVGAAIIHDRSC
jgi:UDP-glucuronate decarboxylase